MEGPELSDAVPVPRQRLAAYAMVVAEGRILLTQLSHRTGWPGGWTLPGGGVDHGEDPKDTVVRETYEETGQHLSEPVLVDVESDHFQGVSPRGVLEDFHAVRLLFQATVAEPAEPIVHDVGGTTSDARWVSLDEAEDLDLVALARNALNRARAGTPEASDRP
jgi:8-oxo-dGTP pyrophosphatase MutT (NUDIX family)